MDIGHVSPQMPIINGGKIEVKSENGKGTLRSYLD
jgi:muramoyltetrapeptide carboxypeptidase LdcA involved in peptidoglycan recycling